MRNGWRDARWARDMTTSMAYFEERYASDPDPWGFASRWYERRKRQVTVASLPQPGYESGFELGCANGDLTKLLAVRCSRLLAVDGVASVVRRARSRTDHLPHVRVEQMVLPSEWPDATFDLIVVCEFLYYFGGRDMDRLLARVRGSLRPGGTLVACHWRHPAAEHQVLGEQAHRAIRELAGLTQVLRHDERDFILEVFQQEPSPGCGVDGVSTATGTQHLGRAGR